MWEGYFSEERRENWMAAAEKLRRINPHVLQDIQDYILLQGFKGKKLSDVKKIIDADVHARRLK